MDFLTKFFAKGSATRDRFKFLHKQMMHQTCYALDADLLLVEKKPRPFIVALWDLKTETNQLSFSEAIAYGLFIAYPQPDNFPVYLIWASDNFSDEQSLPKDHRFGVFQIKKVDYRPDPPTYDGDWIGKDWTWGELAKWEVKLRNERQAEMRAYIRNHKLNGNLP